MMAEGHAFLADVAQFREAEYLEPAGIGQDRMGPVHELVESARFLINS